MTRTSSNYIFQRDWDHNAMVAEIARTDARLVRCETMADAEALAADLGPEWFAYMSNYAAGRYCASKFPQVGDSVSYSFNGDSTPCGTIATISPSKVRVTTTTGDVFHRQKRRPSAWVKNGTWSMIRGHIHERNPHL